MAKELEVYGIVKKISSKKTSNGTMYNILVEEENGDESWFGYGKYKPKFGEGAEIGFDVRMNGDFENVDTKSLDILSAGEEEEEEEEKPRRGGRSGGGRGQSSGNSRRSSGTRSSRGSSAKSDDAGSGRRSARKAADSGSSRKSSGSAKDSMSKDDWAEKDLKIQWQAARNAGIELLGVLLAHDAVPIGTKTTKPADRFDIAMAKLDELTEQFFLDVQERPADVIKNGPSFEEEEEEQGED